MSSGAAVAAERAERNQRSRPGPSGHGRSAKPPVDGTNGVGLGSRLTTPGMERALPTAAACATLPARRGSSSELRVRTGMGPSAQTP